MAPKLSVPPGKPLMCRTCPVRHEAAVTRPVSHVWASLYNWRCWLCSQRWQTGKFGWQQLVSTADQLWQDLQTLLSLPFFKQGDIPPAWSQCGTDGCCVALDFCCALLIQQLSVQHQSALKKQSTAGGKEGGGWGLSCRSLGNFYRGKKAIIDKSFFLSKLFLSSK